MINSEIQLALVGIKFTLIGLAMNVAVGILPLTLSLIEKKWIKFLMTGFSIIILLDITIILLFLASKI